MALATSLGGRLALDRPLWDPTARNTHRTPNPGWAVSVTARQRCLRGQRAWKQATWEHSGMAHPEGRCYTSALPMWPGRMGHGRDACEHQAVQKQSPPPPVPLGSDLPTDRQLGRSEDKPPNCQHWGLLGNGTLANSKKWILLFMFLVF